VVALCPHRHPGKHRPWSQPVGGSRRYERRRPEKTPLYGLVAAHLADRVIPPVPVRQWVVSIPKRLRVFLADRPQAVAALTKIFLAEIERTLLTASGVTSDADAVSASRPRLGERAKPS
jgi:hypothetical protein